MRSDEDLKAHDGKGADNHHRVAKRGFRSRAHYVEAKAEGDYDDYEYMEMLESALVVAQHE